MVKPTKKTTARERVMDAASSSFFDTAIRSEFKDVYAAGFYAAILELAIGEITLADAIDAGRSFNKNWPRPDPKKEPYWMMD